MIASVRKILILVGSEKSKLPFLFVMIICLSLLELLGIGLLVPYVNNIIYGTYGFAGVSLESYFEGNEHQRFILFSTIIVGAFLFKFCFSFFLTGGVTYFAQRQRIKLGEQLLRSHLNSDFITYLNRSDSDGIYEMQTVTAHYFTAIQLLLRFLSDALILMVLSIFLFVINPLVLIITLLITFGVVGGYYLLSKNFLIDFGRRINSAESSVIEVCQDAFRGFREIRFLNKTSFFISLMRAELLKVGQVSVWLNLHAIAPRQLLELVVVLLFVVATIITRSMAVDNEQFTSVAMIYMITTFRMLPLVTNIAAGLARFRGQKDSIDRIYVTINGLAVENITPKESEVRVEEATDIELKNVSYCYPESKESVFNRFSMHINKGEVIGISGPSGIGKTTLINLMSGLLKPTKGQVLYNGISISDLRVNDLSIAYIPQETVSINGSILRNIVLAEDESNEIRKRVMPVAELANLGSLLKELPGGLDTVIGQSGAKISSGQKQRIAIARAIFHNKNFLILDEATNAIDVKTESSIIKNIRNQDKAISMLIISHRPSSLRHCDRIYTMDINGLSEVLDHEDFFYTLETQVDKS